MGKKSTPAAPAAPDPVATAQAQATTNRDAAITQANLNRIDQVTPQGALTYSQNGQNADGTPKYTQTQTLSKDEQAKYDQQNQIALALGGLAGKNIDRVTEAQSKPFTYDGMTPLQTSVKSGAMAGPATPGAIQNQIASAGGITSTIKSAGSITKNVKPGALQSDLDYTKLAALPDANGFDGAAKAAADASYSQATSRLDPQFQQEQSDMSARLANSGIPVGSEAYNREMTNFTNSKNDAYNQAAYSSQAAGLAAQAQGYGQSLSTRQQGVSETNTQGAFHNSTQGQQFDQGMQNATLNNAGQAQQFGQNATSAQFANDAQAQQFGQNATQAQFGNDAQNQKYTQDSNNVAVQNQNQNQQFNQDLTNANLNNSGRQQQIQEASYLRNLPLNDIAALMSGSTVNNPQFNSVSQVGVAAPDYMGAVYQNYNAQNQQYQAAQANKSSFLGSVAGLAGTLGAAAIKSSDRRVKHNVKRVGELANGLATYVFSYIGSTARHFGVMAQEVALFDPSAVAYDDNGYLMVDYGKVY